MGNIAIITARGGSKRIPRKNIKNFMGKPIISYAIEACLKSEIFDEVMVSTDDKEIAEIAKIYGANVPFMRSARTSDDYATTFDVIEEVIKEYKKLGKEFETLCCVYPCVPFLSHDTLKSAYKRTCSHDAVMPVCKYPVPIEWAMNIENDILVPYDMDSQNIRSQDLKPKYFDAGMFYFCKTEKIFVYNSLLPDDTCAYIMPENEVQDIDTIEDWEMAEIKYKLLNAKICNKMRTASNE